MIRISNFYTKSFQNFERVIKTRLAGLFIFNLILMTLILMRSADYFAPFFPLSINFIVLICFIISIPLLGVRDKTLFLIALLLWIFAALLKLLKVDVWAERTAIYAYEGLVIAVILLIFESFRRRR